MPTRTFDRIAHRDEVRIRVEDLRPLITEDKERSIYLHRNWLAREIFWQRLDEVYRLARNITDTQRCLDLGGGTGVLAKSCARLFTEYFIVDTDAEDARRVCEKFKLSNVQVLAEDIFSYSPTQPFDVVLAADVLEHFKDIDRIAATLTQLVRPGGWLIISQPTENWIYEFGRKIINKTKPADHYHNSKTVFKKLEDHGFVRDTSHWIPSFGIPIPLFEIGKLRFSGSVIKNSK